MSERLFLAAPISNFAITSVRFVHILSAQQVLVGHSRLTNKPQNITKIISDFEKSFTGEIKSNKNITLLFKKMLLRSKAFVLH